MLNTRLICHLPLIIPDGCGFRVGNDTRDWKPGKMFLFDDTIEHEAWNTTNAPRYILTFDGPLSTSDPANDPPCALACRSPLLQE